MTPPLSCPPRRRLSLPASLAAAGLCSALFAACGPAEAPPPSIPQDVMSGGDTTIFDDGREAFSYPAKNLTREHKDTFFLGNTTFNRNWVQAPASVTSSDGLGPLYNATSCSACHFKDGRGAPPETDTEPMLGLLVRLSVPGEDAHGGPLAEPAYGGQFNHHSITGVPPEGSCFVEYEEIQGTYPDGEPYSLRRPKLVFADLSYGDMAPDAMTSPRVAPVMIGLGLLEAIPEADILALADEDDADGDGISGRPNFVWSAGANAAVLGRLGWKANQPNMRAQVSGAFLGDMGITSSVRPDADCTPSETACAEAPNGGDPELPDDKLDRVVLYSRTLAVPARREYDDPDVIRGKQLFEAAGCASCHVESFQTGPFEIEELSNQTIFPYTDLLLHDMGEDLADGRPDYLATGTEWRTPPLWGIGLVHVVNHHEYFLHDGRARGLEEAILWHGGEAEPSRESFRAMSAPDREALVRFLESL
ncbi:MAG: di-heme oxidoredictase family protein [Polyangiaceae bacterium]